MKRRLCLLLGLIALLASFYCIRAFATDAEPTLEISGKALELEATVGLSFAVPIEPAKGADVTLLVWTSPRTEEYVYGTQDHVLSQSDEDTVNGVDCIVFTFDGLAAKQMADAVYVRAYASVNGTAYYSNVEKYSILQYAYNKLGKTATATEDEALKATLTALLEYGASAQTLFDYKTDRLVTSDFYKISVEGGYIVTDLSQEGLYLKNEQVTLTAYAENKDAIPFSHWENALGESVGEERQITVTVADANAAYRAVYREVLPEPPALQKVSVSIVDGSITGATDDGLYEVGSIIELVAKENDAACFAYWKNSAGEILSEDSTYSVTVGEGTETYTAVFATPYEYFEFSDTSASTVLIYCKIDISYPQNMILPKYYQGKTVTEIGDSAFKGLTSLKSIELPSSINKIVDNAFSKCTALQTVSMERCMSLTAIPYGCFNGCEKLTTIVLPDSVRTIGNAAFNSCKKLTSFTVSENVISIGVEAFKGCTLLENVTFEETDGWKCGDDAVLSTDLADSSIAAQKLKENLGEAWSRTEN